MTILVVGGSGATGRLLVRRLLDRGHQVRIIVRSPAALPGFLKNRTGLDVISASVLDLSDEELAQHVKNCDAIASCLGHNLTFKGIFGHPRNLVTEVTHRLCETVKTNRPDKPVKFVLMNTTGNRNRDLDEPVPFAQRAIVGLIRLLLPPHADNEKAADYLRTQIGQNNGLIEWAAVRPDGLIDEDRVTEYTLHPSPTRSAIFNPGKTSRVNVGNFMANLLTEPTLWERWKGQMPVIYNTST